jgi:hypothetical protein
MRGGSFTLTLPFRLALVILCLAVTGAGCFLPGSGRPSESPAHHLTIASQHHFNGNLLTSG